LSPETERQLRQALSEKKVGWRTCRSHFFLYCPRGHIRSDQAGKEEEEKEEEKVVEEDEEEDEEQKYAY
jgi:hypothetical protein